ncbi:MAG: succinate-semialdehyde dehydrogenase (NADP(+)) [Proteobacteria bacterium]|nr:MAG: succinate-semialdehyde dehydrogenase (NADP(+)) [Pseudomonadota bacterium]
MRDNQFNNPKIIRQQAFVAGAWCAADNGTVCKVDNPATGEVLGTVPGLGEVETRRAIAGATLAQKSWALKTGKERSAVLRKWHDLMFDNSDDLALLLTLEQGKPVAESKGEILTGLGYLEWFAEEAKRNYGDVIPGHLSDKRLLTIKQPVGVVAAITPWNFPHLMISRKVAPALAAGCAIVVKPALETPFSALAMAYLAQEAGIPDGLFSVVTGDAEPIAGELTGNPVVRKLSFTGSTPVGKLLMRQCADHVKKLTLELGGNAPFIVFDDADVDAAVEGAIASKFRNSGQTCVCANRFFVQDNIYDEFVRKFADAIHTQLVPGSGVEPGVTQGPLISEQSVKRTQALVDDAIAKGATVLTAPRDNILSDGYFFAPVALGEVNTGMRVVQEELFAPVAPLLRFKDEDEVVSLANQTNYGLAGYLYSRDHSRIWRVAEALETGMVGVNTGMITTELAPFGGIKESGLGREGSRYGMEDYIEIKYICLDVNQDG